MHSVHAQKYGVFLFSNYRNISFVLAIEIYSSLTASVHTTCVMYEEPAWCSPVQLVALT